VIFPGTDASTPDYKAQALSLKKLSAEESGAFLFNLI
jgi:hypothetical protein